MKLTVNREVFHKIFRNGVSTSWSTSERRFFNQLSLIEKAEEVALKTTKHIQEIQNTLGTLSTLVSIRNSINTKDKLRRRNSLLRMNTSQLLANGIFGLLSGCLRPKWRAIGKLLARDLLPNGWEQPQGLQSGIIPLLQQENKLSTGIPASFKLPTKSSSKVKPTTCRVWLSLPKILTAEVRRQASELVSAFYKARSRIWPYL